MFWHTSSMKMYCSSCSDWSSFVLSALVSSDCCPAVFWSLNTFCSHLQENLAFSCVQLLSSAEKNCLFQVLPEWQEVMSGSLLAQITIIFSPSHCIFLVGPIKCWREDATVNLIQTSCTYLLIVSALHLLFFLYSYKSLQDRADKFTVMDVYASALMVPPGRQRETRNTIISYHL